MKRRQGLGIPRGRVEDEGDTKVRRQKGPGSLFCAKTPQLERGITPKKD